MRKRPLERGIRAAASIVRESFVHWESASKRGFLQGLDARIKLLMFAAYIVLVSLIRSLPEQAALTVLIFIAVAASRSGIKNIYPRVLAAAFFFGFLIALPASLNVITPGRFVMPLFNTGGPYEFWLWTVPGVVGVTEQGARSVGMLTLRVMNSVTLAFLLLHTTPFPHIIRALRVLRLPEAAVMTIALAYKYIFLLAQMVEDMHRARKSRLLGPSRAAETRGWAAGRLALVFSKSRRRAEELYKAMLVRCMAEDIKAATAPALSLRDVAAGAALALPAAIWAASIIGRQM